MTRPLTWPFANRLDKHDTLSDTTRGMEARARDLAFGRSLFQSLCVFVIIFLLLSFTNSDSAKAYKNHQMNLKLYAHNQIMNWDEFVCYVELIHHESRWDYKAKNGSHYGLGQVRSTWYRDLSPRKQIKAHLRYIEHRYDTVCRALNHFHRKGWH